MTTTGTGAAKHTRRVFPMAAMKGRINCFFFVAGQPVFQSLFPPISIAVASSILAALEFPPREPAVGLRQPPDHHGLPGPGSWPASRSISPRVDDEAAAEAPPAFWSPGVDPLAGPAVCGAVGPEPRHLTVLPPFSTRLLHQKPEVIVADRAQRRTPVHCDLASVRNFGRVLAVKTEKTERKSRYFDLPPPRFLIGSRLCILPPVRQQRQGDMRFRSQPSSVLFGIPPHAYHHVMLSMRRPTDCGLLVRAARPSSLAGG